MNHPLHIRQSRSGTDAPTPSSVRPSGDVSRLQGNNSIRSPDPTPGHTQSQIPAPALCRFQLYPPGEYQTTWCWMSPVEACMATTCRYSPVASWTIRGVRRSVLSNARRLETSRMVPSGEIRWSDVLSADDFGLCQICVIGGPHTYMFFPG